MIDSRDIILGRIRERLGRSAASGARSAVAVDSVIAARAAGPRPPADADPLLTLAAFRSRSEALSSTVDEVASLAEVPRAVAAYLAANGLGSRAVCVPDLAGLEWPGAGIEVEARAARDGDLVGISGCFRAIAETGTLMLCATPGSPATVSLLPETHVAVVPASKIVPGMEEAWAAVRVEFGTLPRAVNFVSGPSRTGDIEQTIVLGAHGPYRVHLVIVRDEG
jgi:L-lactate dehydrogenase complex protein LldG